MKLAVLLLSALLSAGAAGLDFDFTGPVPAAKGKVPMIRLDDSLKIGGCLKRTALHFDGTGEPLKVPGSAGLSLENGITLALDFSSADKGDGKNWQMLVFKPGEWLLDRNGNRICFKWKSGKKWLQVFQQQMTFEHPRRIVLTLDKKLKLTLAIDGKRVRTAELGGQPAPNHRGKGEITLGGGWSTGNFKGDIWRIKVLNEVWNDQKAAEF
jgi:hypothetical protein